MCFTAGSTRTLTDQSHIFRVAAKTPNVVINPGDSHLLIIIAVIASFSVYIFQFFKCKKTKDVEAVV